MLFVIFFCVLALPVVGAACGGLVVDATTYHSDSFAVIIRVRILGAVTGDGMAHTESAVNHFLLLSPGTGSRGRVACRLLGRGCQNDFR